MLEIILCGVDSLFVFIPKVFMKLVEVRFFRQGLERIAHGTGEAAEHGWPERPE
ncbi:MAG: hypothetical protein JJU02_10750 [Cryomorphaceae bacterium]|nr:hypothetical protein [Cryomorphaceae bacterium]